MAAERPPTTPAIFEPEPFPDFGASCWGSFGLSNGDAPLAGGGTEEEVRGVDSDLGGGSAVLIDVITEENVVGTGSDGDETDIWIGV